ncbi:MAG: ADP-ribose pyrophosphatase YjhB (NUDIX family) [Gammaproteobacteria bacterium]|jgi:ADP-ribose pyrophosphatase YjhB (NUDIX family)
MNYCTHCAAPVVHRVPVGDNRPRHVCEGCGLIHYSNPKIIAGALPVWEEQVLLCRRAIEPRHGLWTLPAGFMENGETTQNAARRETEEEACARVDVGDLYCYLNIPRISQVYVIFLARLLDLDFAAGEESLEVELFHEKDIPWDAIAFPAIEIALRHYFEDRKQGAFPTRVFDVERRAS